MTLCGRLITTEREFCITPEAWGGKGQIIDYDGAGRGGGVLQNWKSVGPKPFFALCPPPLCMAKTFSATLPPFCWGQNPPSYCFEAPPLLPVNNGRYQSSEEIIPWANCPPKSDVRVMGSGQPVCTYRTGGGHRPRYTHGYVISLGGGVPP